MEIHGKRYTAAAAIEWLYIQSCHMTLHFPICLVLFPASHPVVWCTFDLPLHKKADVHEQSRVCHMYSGSIWSWAWCVPMLAEYVIINRAETVRSLIDINGWKKYIFSGFPHLLKH